MAQDSIFQYPYQIIPKEIYEPAYQDTASFQVDFIVAIPGPLPVSTHFDINPARPDKGTKRNEYEYDWITVILVACFLVFTFAKHNYSRRMGQLLKACFVPRAVAHLYREGNPFNEQVTLALGTIYLLLSSLFIYIVLSHLNLLPTGLVHNEWLYVAILASNAVYWLVKAMASRALAHIFKTYDATGNYLLNNLLFNLSAGIFFLLILPVVVYTGSTLVLEISLIATLVITIYKVFRGILVGLSISSFPLFFLFLYVIMLEVAPLLILAKFFNAGI
ncbi:MAG: DUF4271 domain-containing protein [Bacteroidales bacterium]|nr:DUF4271 domain-containing protein [Bacteroidales bacterium]